MSIRRASSIVDVNIKVDGNQLSAAYPILSVVVFRAVNRIATAELQFTDGDPATNDFPISNEDMLIPGKSIEIEVGFNGDRETIFKGVIVRHGISFRPGDGGRLTVVCKHPVYKTTLTREAKYFTDSTDLDIIEQLFEGFGFDSQVSSTLPHLEKSTQYNCSNWDYALSRAEANGLVVLTEDDQVIATDLSDISSSAVQLRFGANIYSFDADMDARDQSASVKSFAWDPSEQNILESEAGAPSLSLPGNLSPDDLADAINSGERQLRTGAELDEEQLQLWADAQLKKQYLAKIRGVARCLGDPALLPGKYVDIEGIGDRFNGTYFISGIQHEIAEGTWQTEVQLGLDPEWFANQYEIDAPPAAALLPAVSGLQIGRVTDIVDPAGAERIQVNLPLIQTEGEGQWCRLATLDAGADRGTVFRPEVSDEVIVGFLNDDPRQGVILGQLHSSDRAAPLAAEEENNEKGWVSRSGIKMLFDDAKKIIHLETPAGNKLIIDDDRTSIIIEDQHSNKIEMSSAGIDMSSNGKITIKAGGDLEMEGMNVKIKSSASLTAEGGATAELKSSGSTVVKGSIVQIN